LGTAFSSSLLGLAGSLVIGLLELFAGHGQNRFYNELEDWLSGMTRVSLAADDAGPAGEGRSAALIADHLDDQLAAVRALVAQGDAAAERLDRIAETLARLTDRLGSGETAAALARLADGQDRLIALMADGAGGGVDAESRMRLRSIDVQLLRIFEEIAAGRQETVADLRAEIGALAGAMRAAARPGSGGPG
jgi:uncharacterized protein YukE